MTEITDAEAAEVQWTSSEEGRAAFRAAWERAKALGIDRRAAGMADVSAVTYAAHLAAAAEAGQAEGGEAPAHPGTVTVPRGDFSILLAAAAAVTGSEPVPELLRPLAAEVLARYKVRLETS